MVLINNRRRLLSEVASLDAWHSPIKTGAGKTQVSVELTFKEGRLGGDDEDFPFTFKMALKRATLSVSVEEPLLIDRRSIARNVPEALIEQTKIRSLREKMQANMGGKTTFGTDGLSSNFSIGANSSFAGANAEETKLVQMVPPILVVSEPYGAQEYRWTFEPSFTATLLGQPWDPVSEPRLAARYDFAEPPKICPEVEVTLTCKLSDVMIEDIQPKDPSVRDRLKGRYSYDARNSAAQQHLKQVLRVANLEPGSMDNRFSGLVLATVMSASEPED
jgi:hypothetical protein